MKKRVIVLSVLLLFGIVVTGIKLWEKRENEFINQAQAQNNNVNDGNDKIMDVVLIGDSNTEISYFKKDPEKRWSSLIAVGLDANVINLGRGGRSTSDFLNNGKKEETEGRWIGESWKKVQGDYYIICFGLNDSKYYNENDFEKYTREMIDIVRNDLKGVPILMTNVHVPYPDYFSFDRNEIIDSYDNVKRKIASELNLHLIEVNKRFEKEWKENGVWDTRIRTEAIWDDSEDEGKTVEDGWFDNIHYNELGNKIVAEEVVKYFKENILKR